MIDWAHRVTDHIVEDQPWNEMKCAAIEPLHSWLSYPKVSYWDDGKNLFFLHTDSGVSVCRSQVFGPTTVILLLRILPHLHCSNISIPCRTWISTWYLLCPPTSPEHTSEVSNKLNIFSPAISSVSYIWASFRQMWESLPPTSKFAARTITAHLEKGQAIKL